MRLPHDCFTRFALPCLADAILETLGIRKEVSARRLSRSASGGISTCGDSFRLSDSGLGHSDPWSEDTFGDGSDVMIMANTIHGAKERLESREASEGGDGRALPRRGFTPAQSAERKNSSEFFATVPFASSELVDQDLEIPKGEEELDDGSFDGDFIRLRRAHSVAARSSGSVWEQKNKAEDSVGAGAANFAAGAATETRKYSAPSGHV